jgi:hypothetical protein
MTQYHVLTRSPSDKGFVCQRCGLAWPPKLIPPPSGIGFETINREGMTTDLVSTRPKARRFIWPCPPGICSRGGAIFFRTAHN